MKLYDVFGRGGVVREEGGRGGGPWESGERRGLEVGLEAGSGEMEPSSVELMRALWCE